MITAAGYLRRSTTKQEQSLDGQRKAIEQFATQNAYKIVRWYTDDGISGSTGDARPNFLQMISDASGGEFLAVIAYDLSRFGRMDGDETGHYRFLLRQAGVRILFSNENDGGNDETGEIIRPMLQAQKRQFLRQISRDTLRGQVQSARAGWASGRAASFGYDRMFVDENGVPRQRLKRGAQFSKPRAWHVTLVPSDTPGETDTLKWIFSTYLEKEIGCAELARQLNERGVASPSGMDWSMGTVREILRNPLYKGWLCFGRRSEGKFHRLRNGEVMPATDADRPVVVTPEEHWLIHQKPELELVPESVWNAVNVKLKARGSHVRRAQARKLAYPLGGLVRCADCGEIMVGMRRDQRYRIYACASHFRNKKCHSNTVRHEALLKVTLDIVFDRLFCGRNWDRFRALIFEQAARRPECQREDLEHLTRQLAASKHQHQRAAQNLLLADPENVPALNAAMTGIREKVRELEGEIAAIRQPLDPSQLAEEGVAQAKRLLSKLESDNEQDLKHGLCELIERIDLEFTDGYWGKRKVRMVAGGCVSLRQPTLTTENRGDRI